MLLLTWKRENWRTGGDIWTMFLVLNGYYCLPVVENLGQFNLYGISTILSDAFENLLKVLKIFLKIFKETDTSKTLPQFR